MHASYYSYFLILFALLVSHHLDAQITTAALLTADIDQNENRIDLLVLARDVKEETFTKVDGKIEEPKSIMLTTPSMGHTAFFCKLEDKLQRKSKVPVRFRLGDIRYTDYMEGKTTALLLEP